MGQHNSNFELASEARRAAERFDECEIKVIKETFKDLCHLNGGSMRIDKETFLQYLPLPGLLGERLFAVFDKKCSGEIDYEEFVCGLAVTCRGSWDEKVEFIFNIYDMHGQGAVNRNELAALLNHVPKSIMRFGRAMSLDASEHHHHHHHNQHHHHAQQQHREHRRSSAPTRHPPPSSTGTASALSEAGRCSPDRSSTATPTAAVTVRGGGGATMTGGKGVSGGGGPVSAGAAAPPPAPPPAVHAKDPGDGIPPADDSPLLTSGNLMQLHLASLSPTNENAAGGGGGGGAVREAEEGEGSGGNSSSRHAMGGSSSPPPLSANGVARGGSGVGKSVEGSGGGGGGGSGVAVSPTVSAVSASSASAAAIEPPPPADAAHASSGSKDGDVGAPPAVAQAEREAEAADGVASSGDDGLASGTVGGAAIAAAAGGGGVGGGGGSSPSATGGDTHVGIGDDGGSSGRRNTLHSDASTDDGTSAAAPEHSHYAHWEEFTNNDIVDQAFEDCDLNHNGKLSFSEFRLWVERNPIVTQFLQSVFPYDEHREWGDDRKHLPFIHNREFTGSPMLSDAGNPGDSDGSDDETRRLLVKARNTTRDPMLREGIDRLIEQAGGGGDGGEGIHLSGGSINGVAFSEGPSQNGDGGLRGGYRRSSTGNTSTGGNGFMSELSPRSAKAMQHQTVAKQGFLWKQGHRLRTWKQRWYVLVGNCIYYYQHEDDVYPCGVMFLTGSFVEPLQEGANERKGFWGLEISRNNEQNHRRRWYTRSKVEQLKWLKELRKASAVVPIEDDFEIGEELGQGRFSRVCMCVNKHSLERKAVKIIMKEDMRAEEKDLLRAEIAIMKLVNHPNIVRMEAVYESKKDIFIVMELHSGGELFDRIVGRPRFTEDEAFTVIHPLVESVAYLHEMGIVHRDLKPENILCGNRIGDIKIADFGLSKMVMPDEIMKMPCGTLTYVAPEVLTLNGYGKEADIWSVGTIMYLLLRGRLPFDGATREEIIENTIHATIAWQNDHVWAGFSDDGKNLVLGMLNKDTTQRYKAKDVLRHPWTTQRVQRREEHPEQFDF